MKKSLFFFISSLFLLSSCGSLFLQKLLLNVKNPKFKTEKQVLHFLEKKHFSNNNVFALTKVSFEKKINRESSPFATWRLYNKEGFRVIPSDEAVETCIGGIEDFISKISDSLIYKIDRNDNVFNDTNVVEGFANLSGEKRPLFQTHTHDFTLIIYWSVFMGKYSTDMLKLESYIYKNEPEFKIQVIKINMDFRDYMNEEGNNPLPKFKKKNKQIELLW